MKRKIKALWIFLIIIGIFTVSSSGCKPYIDGDDNPEDYVTISKDKETLDFEGKTYYKLPQDAELFLVQKTSNNTVIYDAVDEYVNVEKEGTPEVVSNIFYSVAYYTKSTDSFKVEFWDISKVIIDSKNYSPPTEFYCNKATYDSYTEFKESGKPLDRIGFEYYSSPENSQEYSFSLGVLSEDASKEILSCLYNDSGWSSADYDGLQKNVVKQNVLYGMFKCDETGVFARHLKDYDICKTYSTNAYLINKTNCTAKALSAETSREIKEEYLHADFSNTQN